VGPAVSWCRRRVGRILPALVYLWLPEDVLDDRNALRDGELLDDGVEGVGAAPT